MRLEEYIPFKGMEFTPNAKWHEGPNQGHWYEASTAFALEYLGNGNKRSCLVIGSPIFEAIELQRRGWDTTYMDIRHPPKSVGKAIHMDACNITLPDASFDAVSTACVLTHAGLGRYGDDKHAGRDDQTMLAHIARLLKPGAPAALSFGACVTAEKMIRLGSAHRIYTIAEGERMIAAAGLVIDHMKIWSCTTKAWTDEAPTQDIYNPDYISFAVTKPNE